MKNQQEKSVNGEKGFDNSEGVWARSFNAVNEMIFDNAHMAIAILDRDFNFVRVNELYARADNRKPEDFPGKNHFDLYPSNARVIFERVVATKKPYKTIARAFVYSEHPERGTTYWDWTLDPVLNDQGDVELLVFILKNATNRVNTERELYNFFNLSLDVFVMIGFDGAIKRVNPVMSRLLGYDNEFFLSINVFDVINRVVHPEDRETTLYVYNKSVTSGVPVYNFENRLQCSDGSYKWLSWSISTDPENGILYFVGKDITEKKLAEQKLKHSEQRFYKVFHASPSMMAILTIKEGLYVDVNKSFLNYTEYSREDLIGSRYSEITLAVEDESINIGEKLLRDKENLINEAIRYRTKSGKIRQGLMSREIIELYGEPCAIIVVLDITERRMLEKEIARLDRLQLIGQLAGGIGHEIRNPLTTIKGFLQLLQKKPKNKEDDEFFSLMISELDRANDIITEFLSLSRKRSEDLRPGSINQVIKTIYPLLQAYAFRCDKQVCTDLGETQAIPMDGKEIRQLVLNLVQNGLDATPVGGTVTVRTYIDNNYSVMSVKDQGEGIDPAILPQLGTPFLTTKEKGTGLGLAVCYSIVERHGGRIEFETGAGGTTFYIRFPVFPKRRDVSA